jgi:hypothetical protein
MKEDFRKRRFLPGIEPALAERRMRKIDKQSELNKLNKCKHMLELDLK